MRPTRIPEPQAQLGVHARRAVRAPALGVDPRDDRAEDFVAESPLALRTSAPGIKAGVGDAKHAAGGAHRGLLALDEPEHRYRLRLPLSWAKKAAAFFRMSRSSTRTLFSRRSRRSSSRSSVVRPSSRLPLSRSTCLSQCRSDSVAMPSSGDRRQGLAARAIQPDRVFPELPGIGLATLGHVDLLGVALRHTISGDPRKRVNSTLAQPCG